MILCLNISIACAIRGVRVISSSSLLNLKPILIHDDVILKLAVSI